MAELTDQAAEALRLEVASQQLQIAGRPERELCHVVLADEWSSKAPRCAERATHYVCFDNYRTGLLTGGMFAPGQSMTRLCPEHEKQVRRGTGWRWSEVLES